METLKITALAFTAFLISAPNPVGVLVSLLFGFYVLNMLYFNVIKVYYGGSWREYARKLYERLKGYLK